MINICVLFFLSVGLLLTDHGVSADDTDRVSVFVMEGDPVTLNTSVQMNQQEKIIWYYKNIRLAHLSGGQSKICTDDQCDERFRDRLKLDHQTGSLIIMNTTNTDSGLYKLVQIIVSNRQQFFDLNVTAVPDSGPSSAVPDSGLPPAAIGGIIAAAAVVLLAAAGGVLYRRHQERQKDIEMQAEIKEQSLEEPEQNDALMQNTANEIRAANGTISNSTEAAQEKSA